LLCTVRVQSNSTKAVSWLKKERANCVVQKRKRLLVSQNVSPKVLVPIETVMNFSFLLPLGIWIEQAH